MKHRLLLLVAIVTIIALITACGNRSKKETLTSQETEKQTTEKEYPIDDVWVYRYDAETRESMFAPCGYIDEHTSIVTKTDKTISRLITGSYMYLGTIKGYQNNDKTIEVYQVTLPELSNNFTLTNDNIELDYSGNKQMIEVSGWIYMDGMTILAVSPLY